MFLTLREKRQQKMAAFRAVILTMNTAGLLFCLYLERILASVTKNREMEELCNRLILENGFLLEEFTTVIRIAQGFLLVLILGLCIMVYHLIAHEVQARGRIHELLYSIGYRALYVYAYEFVYELWDLLFGFVASCVGLGFVRFWLMGIGDIKNVLEAVGWNPGRELAVFLVVLFLLFVLDACAVFLKGMRS